MLLRLLWQVRAQTATCELNTAGQLKPIMSLQVARSRREVMAARVETEWTYRNLRVLRLENEFLRLDILPELGAKVYNLIHK